MEDTNTVATPSITSTRDCMLLVAEWLRICRSEHDSCHKLNKDFVPTRLIGLDAEHPYILDKADTPGSVPYTTLSHCWGNNDFATLKSDSLMAFKQEIPQEAISVVFEDAFYITRVLGFKYIWIDALCIVQDDVEDWRIETSKVNDIFGNSKLNIAASGAASGHESCFIQRPAHWRAQVELYGDIREIVPSNLTHRMLKSMPLESRGWALQERMLSRRTVHFTSTEMVWECCAGMKSESFPGRLPSICTLDIDKMCQGAVEVSDWPKIVEEFTRRELTQPTDKLVAIAGLARKFHAKTNDQYIAGMWRQDLTFQLCWSVYGERENKGLYVAPSWSWASIPNGAVNTSPAPIDVFSWDDLLSSDISVRNTHSMVQVVDIILQYAGEDVFGALEGAELILEVEALAPVSHHHGDGNIRICNEEVKCDFSFDYKMDDDIESLQETYALSILSSKDNGELWGLLLTREVARRGTYRRIGLCQFGPAEAQAFQRVMNEGLWNNVRSECYLDADLRSIRLI